MTIHHDKICYGKLVKTSEELSQEKLDEMLNKLRKDEALCKKEEVNAKNENVFEENKK